MDLTLALLLTITTLLGYAIGYVLGWTDHRSKARRR